MNKLNIKKLDTDTASAFAVLSEDGAPIPRKLTFFDIFSEIHSAPEDVDSIKLFYGHMGISEDRHQIRKYFKKAISDLGMDRMYTR